MTDEKLNPKFEIELSCLEDKIHRKINGDFKDYNKIVSSRDIVNLHEVSFLTEGVLTDLIQNIPLRNSSHLPYRNSKIEVYRSEPKSYTIGQSFIDSRKILSLMGNLENNLLNSFFCKGISQLLPLKLYGINKNGEKVISLLIPPIIEHHDEKGVLIDGMHRSYICNCSGSSINGVHIYDIDAPLPFSPINWKHVKMVDIKPPKEERYKELKIEFFRDLGSVGIDG